MTKIDWKSIAYNKNKSYVKMLEILHNNGRLYYNTGEYVDVYIEKYRIYNKEKGGYKTKLYEKKYKDIVQKIIDVNRETNLSELFIYFDDIIYIDIVFSPIS